MNENKTSCAPADNQQTLWDRIDWTKAELAVRKLQARIVKAQKEGRYNKVKALQWTLTHSFYAKALAVKRVTSNGGGNTPGVDMETWEKPEAKTQAISELKRRGYQPKPLRRVHIKKSNGKLRPLGIPTMKDRAMQALYLMALEPVSETTADSRSYGFRKERRCMDAVMQCHNILRKGYSPEWILEGDIKGCFDHISHEWLIWSKHPYGQGNTPKMVEMRLYLQQTDVPDRGGNATRWHYLSHACQYDIGRIAESPCREI